MKKAIALIACAIFLAISVFVFVWFYNKPPELPDYSNDAHNLEVKSFEVTGDWGDLDTGMVGVIRTALINEFINNGYTADKVEIKEWSLDEDSYYNVVCEYKGKKFLFQKGPVGTPNVLKEYAGE